MTRSPLRHLQPPHMSIGEIAQRAADIDALPIFEQPTTWAMGGRVYIDLDKYREALTPDEADGLADAIHAAAEEARRQ